MANKTIGALTPTAAVVLTDKVPKEPTAGPPAEYFLISQLVTLLNTIYAPITGGAYVLKSGDTMTGPLLFSADNTIDIGASGATRPRTGYFGTSLITALLASPAATALSFASAGTTRANFSTAGHLLFNTDNTNDIGAAGATRPRNVYVGTNVIMGGGFPFIDSVAAGGQLVLNSTNNIFFQTNGTGRWSIISNNFQPESDNLGDIGEAADNRPRTIYVATSVIAPTVQTTPGVTVAALPAAGNAGSRKFVTNALAPTFGATVAGGGAVVIPVFDNGTNWIVG